VGGKDSIDNLPNKYYHINRNTSSGYGFVKVVYQNHSLIREWGKVCLKPRIDQYRVHREEISIGENQSLGKPEKAGSKLA
jgi:hypothetical protein